MSRRYEVLIGIQLESMKITPIIFKVDVNLCPLGIEVLNWNKYEIDWLSN